MGIGAAECGYYDQAHVDRDFRDFAGTSPSADLAERVTFVQDASPLDPSLQVPISEDKMTEQTPNIFPAMRFADPDAAADWLSRAFGFQQRAVHRDEQGVIRHAEMSLGSGTIMFGQGDPNSHGIYVAVEDADAHCERAKAAGAEITREIEDTPYGSREYSARDPEGHAWSFGTYRPDAGR